MVDLSKNFYEQKDFPRVVKFIKEKFEDSPKQNKINLRGQAKTFVDNIATLKTEFKEEL